MATLAELFASSQAPNVNQLPTQPVGFQRPGGFRKTAGTILDVLAAFGGAKPGYSTGIDAQENKYNTAMKEQQFQNVFRNFVENPDDPAVQANLAYTDPDAFMKVAPQNKALGNRVVRMGPLGTPEVVVEAPVEPVAAPRPERLVATERGFLPESQAVGLMPFRAPPARAAASSGGAPPAKPGATPVFNGGKPLPGNTAFAQRYNAILANDGPEAAAEFARTGKAGGMSEETGNRLGNVVQNLRSAYDQLDLEGGAVSEDAGMFANAGNILAAEMPMLGRIAGTKAQTQRDIILGQRAALFNAVAKAQGVTGTQLNSIPELKLQIQQATDPAAGIQANRKALEFIEQNYLSAPRPDVFGRKSGPAAAPRGVPAGAQTATNAKGEKIYFDATQGKWLAAPK